MSRPETVSSPNIFLLHIPKTAGSSLIGLFTSRLSSKAFETFIDGHPLSVRLELGDRSFLSGHLEYKDVFSLPYIERFSVITFFRDPVARLASAISWLDHYNMRAFHDQALAFPEAVQYWIRKVAKVDFEDGNSLAGFLHDPCPVGLSFFDNVQTRYFVNDLGDVRTRALTPSVLPSFEQRLTRLAFVGSVETMAQSVERLEQLTGQTFGPAPRENVNPATRTVPVHKPDVREALAAHTKVDLLAYRHAAERFGWPALRS